MELIWKSKLSLFYLVLLLQGTLGTERNRSWWRVDQYISSWYANQVHEDETATQLLTELTPHSQATWGFFGPNAFPTGGTNTENSEENYLNEINNLLDVNNLLDENNILNQNALNQNALNQNAEEVQFQGFEMPFMNQEISFDALQNHSNAEIQNLFAEHPNITDAEKEYFKSIMSYINANFEFSLQNLHGPHVESILQTAKSYNQKFESNMRGDVWKLLEDPKIVTQTDYDRTIQLLDKLNDGSITQVEKNELEWNANEILKCFMEYYGPIAKNEISVNAYAQVSHVLPELKRMLPLFWIPFQKWIVQVMFFCDRTIREGENYCSVFKRPFKKENLNYGCKTLKRGFTPLLILFSAFFLQTFVPLYIGWDYVYRNKLFTDGGCPMPFGELSDRRFGFPQSYDWVIKTTGIGLFFYTAHFLNDNLKDELKLIETNWQSYAISKFGLKLSYVMNSIASTLVLIDTVMVFFGTPDLLDIVLNYVALQFLVNIDEEIAQRFLVTKGKQSKKDEGVELVLHAIENGRREQGNFELWKNTSSFATHFGQIFIFIVLCLGIWTIGCLR